jgi:hypothetical protein
VIAADIISHIHEADHHRIRETKHHRTTTLAV